MGIVFPVRDKIRGRKMVSRESKVAKSVFLRVPTLEFSFGSDQDLGVQYFLVKRDFRAVDQWYCSVSLSSSALFRGTAGYAPAFGRS